MDISFTTLLDGFLQRWKLLAAVVIVSWLAGAIYVLVTPIEYSVQTDFYVEDIMGNKQQSSGLMGLVASVGLGSGESTNRQVTIATLRSRQLAMDFVQQRDLLPVLFPDRWDAATKRWSVEKERIPTLVDGAGKFLSGYRLTDDASTGTITLTLTHTRADLVAGLANGYVAFADNVLRRRALARSQESLSYLQGQITSTSTTELRASIIKLMESHLQRITMIKTSGPFQLNVLDPALTPRSPSWPRKRLIFSALTLCGFLAGLLLSVLLDLRVARRIP